MCFVATPNAVAKEECPEELPLNPDGADLKRWLECQPAAKRAQIMEVLTKQATAETPLSSSPSSLSSRSVDINKLRFAI
jgi:hypothetical protein